MVSFSALVMRRPSHGGGATNRRALRPTNTAKHKTKPTHTLQRHDTTTTTTKAPCERQMKRSITLARSIRS